MPMGDDPGAGTWSIGGSKICLVFHYRQSLSPWQNSARRKGEVDTAGELPAAQVHWLGTIIEQFHKLRFA